MCHSGPAWHGLEDQWGQLGFLDLQEQQLAEYEEYFSIYRFPEFSLQFGVTLVLPAISKQSIV